MGMNGRLLRPRASGLNPKSIADLQLWLDASNISGMRQLSDGTTSVSADADPVGYWPDLSGNNYHATQSTTNNRPTLRTGVRNGRSVLRFDGTNDSYRVASLPLDATCSVFVAGQFNSATAPGTLFIEHSANSNTSSGFYVLGQSAAPQQITRTTAPTFRFAQAGVTTWLGTAWSVAEFRFSAGSSIDAVLAYWKNGTLQANNGSQSGSITEAGTATSGRSATADLFIGSRNQASIFSSGDFAEILVYNRPLTDAEHTRVRRYLGSKWNVVVT